jgi:hypothetical protein
MTRDKDGFSRSRWGQANLGDLCLLNPSWWLSEDPLAVKRERLEERWQVFGQPTQIERALGDVSTLFERAQALTQLAPGDGCEQQTLDRGRLLLRGVVTLSHDLWGLDVPMPDLGPAGGGALDLYWELEDRTLLVSVPAAQDQATVFYGRNGTGNTLSGEIVGNYIAHVAAWLVM